MKTIFLSASVPLVERGNYHETSNPFLIQCAVREFVIATIRRYCIVWGGHPAITPMVWNICADLGVSYSDAVVLYQSSFFRDRFPDENEKFRNVVFVDAVDQDKEASLAAMRHAMLSRDEYVAGVFIGGMDGIDSEYSMFVDLHPQAEAILVPAPGGAALELAKRLGTFSEQQLHDVDFARLFHSKFNAISEHELRRR